LNVEGYRKNKIQIKLVLIQERREDILKSINKRQMKTQMKN